MRWRPLCSHALSEETALTCAIYALAQAIYLEDKRLSPPCNWSRPRYCASGSAIVRHYSGERFSLVALLFTCIMAREVKNSATSCARTVAHSLAHACCAYTVYTLRLPRASTLEQTPTPTTTNTTTQTRDSSHSRFQHPHFYYTPHTQFQHTPDLTRYDFV